MSLLLKIFYNQKFSIVFRNHRIISNYRIIQIHKVEYCEEKVANEVLASFLLTPSSQSTTHDLLLRLPTYIQMLMIKNNIPIDKEKLLAS
jgi:hypothetical protein